MMRRRNPRDVAKRRAHAADQRQRAARARHPLVLNAVTAAEFVKLQFAGLPYPHVMHYLAPEYWATLDDEARGRAINQWLASPLVAKAAADFNKGAWQDLARERRVELALDKHASELAYLLYTHNVNDIDDSLTLKKVNDARAALFEMQRLSQGGDQSAFARMVADLLAGTIDREGEFEPPRATADDAEGEAPALTIGRSVPIEAMAGPLKES